MGAVPSSRVGTIDPFFETCKLARLSMLAQSIIWELEATQRGQFRHGKL